MRGAEWPRGLISLRFQEHALTPHLCILHPTTRSVGKWYVTAFGTRASGVRFTALRPISPGRQIW